MKKLFVFLLLAVVFTSFANAQQWQWVNFSSSASGAPKVNLLTSNAQTVSFEVTIPGIYTMDTIVNGITFSRLFLPDGAAVNPAGSPELPVLKYKVAIPVCSETVLDYRVHSRQILNPCLAYPVPSIISEINSEGFSVCVEDFTFDSVAYAQPRSDEPVAVITSNGALRAQRYVEVMVQPIEYCPVTQQLSVIDKVQVTLDFTNPQGEIRQNVGIFNAAATTAFINYEDNGISALLNDKAFERENFTPGNVEWITLTDTAQACQIIADYLIICADTFFTSQNVDVQRFAEHRAFYNGFDVAIVNVENILALNFYYENPTPTYKNEQRMRTFIKRVYEGKHAQHTGSEGDTCLSYVLLIGDNYTGNTGMPTATEHGVYVAGSNEKYRSDYYFSCITKDSNGQYDDVGDLFIGRFSVENETQLYNMVQKTIHYEREFSPKSWRKSAGITHGSPFDASYHIIYFNWLETLLYSQGWNYSTVKYFALNGAIKEPTLNYLNEGVVFAQYFGHGHYTGWEGNLVQSIFSSELNNAYKTPFINAIACETGWFDNKECVGEFLTRYSDTLGAVAYSGASRGVWLSAALPLPANRYQECVPDCFFSEKISIAGDLILKAKLKNANYQEQDKYAYNLFGDPALNILAVGFEVTHDVTADLVAEIPCKVWVHNGATLTIPENGTFKFLPEGKLIVQENGNFNVQANAQINGVHGVAEPAIHVQGGGFTIGEDVEFNNINTVLLKNDGTDFYDDNKQYNLSNITFNNTPLTHDGTKLNVSNCIFSDRSDILTMYSKVDIQDCHFSESGFRAFATPIVSIPEVPVSFTPFVSITNSSFRNTGKFITSDDMGNSIYSTASIMLDGIKEFQITADTIISVNAGKGSSPHDSLYVHHQYYGEGIYLNNAGQGNVGLRLISENDISACETGLYVYNSQSTFKNNYIHDNQYGVRLFNYSSTSFLGEQNIANGQQFIRDNNLYELYASNNSFPTQFKYNQVIDEDNKGNGKNDPMIYYDSFPFCPPMNVSCNYWGNNFSASEDLYPEGKYLVDPIWDLTGDCTSGGKSLYDAGIEYFSAEDYLAAKATFTELISTYPDDQFSIAALHELFALEQFLDNDYAALHDYYATFTPADSILFDVADFLATRCNVTLQNWQPAIDWYEDRIENPPSYQDSIFAVIDLGDIT